MIAIESAESGYILWLIRDDEDEPPQRPVVFGYYDDCQDYEKEECKAMKLLIYRMMEELGMTYSKHNKFNVTINVTDQNGDVIE